MAFFSIAAVQRVASASKGHRGALTAGAVRLTQGNDARRERAPNGLVQNDRKPVMHALKDLFTSDVGLMSLAGLSFMLGMGVFFVRYFLRHIREDAAAAAAAAAQAERPR